MNRAAVTLALCLFTACATSKPAAPAPARNHSTPAAVRPLPDDSVAAVAATFPAAPPSPNPPASLATETANARQGLEQGYPTPRRAAEPALKQIEGFVVAAKESPLSETARRANDPAFATEWTALLDQKLRPAITR